MIYSPTQPPVSGKPGRISLQVTAPDGPPPFLNLTGAPLFGKRLDTLAACDTGIPVSRSPASRDSPFPSLTLPLTEKLVAKDRAREKPAALQDRQNPPRDETGASLRRVCRTYRFSAYNVKRFCRFFLKNRPFFLQSSAPPVNGPKTLVTFGFVTNPQKPTGF